MASSSSSPPEKYPFPSEVNVENFVPIKLSETNYSVWKRLMLRLIETFDLVGFIHDSPPGANDIQYKAWKRSDALLSSWILGTVDQDLLPHVVTLTTAKSMWEALQKMLHTQEDYRELPVGENVTQYLPLLKAAVSGDWNSAREFLEQRPDAVKAAITARDETALMVALRSLPGINFVKKLEDLMSREDLEVVDCFGQTALHHAAISGKVEEAKLVVSKHPDLPNVGRNDDEELPIHLAAMWGRREMVLYLMGVTEEDGETKPFEGERGVKFVNDLIYMALYDTALFVVQCYPKLARVKSSPLKVMALRRSAFPSGTSLNFWQRLIYSYVPMKLENFANNCRGDVQNPTNGFISVSQKVCAVFWKGIEILVPHCIKDVQQTKLMHHQALQLVKHLCKEVATLNMTEAYNCFQEPLRLATSVGIPEVVEEICDSIPGMIKMNFQKEKSVFHMAIANRQENIFNLIYQFNEGRRPNFLLWPNKLGNNCLHLAGELNSEQKLNIRASAAGAALQMQRELQWFKEVETIVPPQFREMKNNKGKTPIMIFTETHEDLVREGERWMKDTANSCTIVGALIATIAFAAAITVPGGNNSNNGFPYFSKEKAFIIFAISNACSLFSSTSSVLMFLSILTSRYSQEDFLNALPKRLIIGLGTLFLSIISMMISFGTTLYLLFGENKAWVLIFVVASACIPVTLFASLQFPLLLDMIKSTYGPSIFRKQSDRLLF